MPAPRFAAAPVLNIALICRPASGRGDGT